MNARWPNAFLLSTTLHAAVVGIALWLGYEVIEQSQVPRQMVLVAANSLDGRTESAAVTAPTSSVHFTAPPRPVTVPRVAESEESATDERPTAVTHLARPRPISSTPRVATVPAHSVKPVQSSRATHSVAAGVTHVDVTELTASLREEAVIGPATRASDGGDTSYRAAMETALRQSLESEPGLDDGLTAEAEFHVTADGRAIQPRFIHRSGNDRFDAAILASIAALTLGPRPADFPEVQRVRFATHARR